MDSVASQEAVYFLLNTGDSFYEQEGTAKIDKASLDTHELFGIFESLPHLKDLDWYGVLGNRDYSNEGITELLGYREHRWRLDDHFWSHTMIADDEKKVAFVHIDTSFLAYGEYGEVGNANMGDYFAKKDWTEWKQQSIF